MPEEDLDRYWLILNADGRVHGAQTYQVNHTPYLEAGQTYHVIEENPEQYLGQYYDGSSFRQASAEEELSLVWNDLQSYKIYLKRSIDNAAGMARKQWVSGGEGQQMTYLAKEAEAKEYLEAQNPVDTDYPMLLAEVGVTAATTLEVATVINTLAIGWRQTSGQIENVRLTAKQAISDASDYTSAQAVYDAVAWPTPPA